MSLFSRSGHFTTVKMLASVFPFLDGGQSILCGSKSGSHFSGVWSRLHTFFIRREGMIIKCSKCGHQKIVDSPLYSSPAIKCDACGDYFYESKFKEAALYPPPVNVKEKQHFFTYCAGVLGILFFLFGVICTITEADASYLGMALFGLILFATQFFLIWNANKEYRKREETFQKALAESKSRLRSKRYQDLLISCSNSNETVIKLLEQYNSKNNLTPVDDPIISEAASVAPAHLQPQEIEVSPKETVSTNNVFCRKCGAKLFDDSVFCHRCGEKTRNE